MLFPWFPSTASAQAPATLEVAGRASVEVAPDVAIVGFTVESTAREAGQAITVNAAQAERLMTALKSLLGPNDRLSTSQYQLQPVYDKDNQLQPSGYRVSSQVLLNTHQVKAVGAFIDAAAGAGASRIGSLSFVSSEADQHARRAATLAVAQAQATAEKLATAADVSLLRILQIRFVPDESPTLYRAEMALTRAQTPIEAGDLTIEAEVKITYEIGPPPAPSIPAQ
jgi:uncharacterized protein YggE